MYNLYKLSDNLYQIHSAYNGAREGTLASIYKHCVKELDIPERELEAALIDMVRNDHNGANFGMNRFFIFSFKRNERKVS